MKYNSVSFSIYQIFRIYITRFSGKSYKNNSDSKKFFIYNAVVNFPKQQNWLTAAQILF